MTTLSRRQDPNLFVAAMLILATCAMMMNCTGCKTLGYITDKPKVDEVFTGYGPVNHPDAWDDLAEKCAKHGIQVAHIELFAWASESRYGRFDSIVEPYKDLVRDCRLRNVVLLVSIANDNKGSRSQRYPMDAAQARKYGDNGLPLSNYKDDLLRAVELIKEVGPKNVWVQPVGETQTSTGRWFEQVCLQELGPAGFTLIYNGGSRPYAAPPGFHGFAYHPASTKHPVPAGAIVVTDHSIILGELQNGNLYGTANKDALKAYADKIRDGGNAIIHYGFWHDEVDSDSLDALER